MCDCIYKKAMDALAARMDTYEGNTDQTANSYCRNRILSELRTQLNKIGITTMPQCSAVAWVGSKKYHCQLKAGHVDQHEEVLGGGVSVTWWP